MVSLVCVCMFRKSEYVVECDVICATCPEHRAWDRSDNENSESLGISNETPSKLKLCVSIVIVCFNVCEPGRAACVERPHAYNSNVVDESHLSGPSTLKAAVKHIAGVLTYPLQR